MGVRGLQSFLKDNRGSLCRSVILEQVSQDGEEKGTIPIVVDAWGIIYKLYLDSLPWTSGGEYLRFYKLVKALVRGWRRVGLEPTFVFDGATPPAKHDTLLRRLSDQILTCQLFYTTSKTSRSAPSFSREANHRLILPAFASHTFFFALSRLDVKTHFVPIGEADGVCVMLAERMGAYVLGQDSDFVILAGRAGENIKGYCPLDMIDWIEGEVKPVQTIDRQAKPDIYRPPRLRNRAAAPHPSTQSDSFTTVNNRRHNPHAPRHSPLLPPIHYQKPSLVLTTYPPQGLRQRLRLPPNYLPLFASLCGNDYTPLSTAHQFFEPTLGPSQKIEKVARILREQLFSPSSSPTSIKSSSNRSTPTPNPADQVVELVKRVVKKLSVFPFETEHSLLELVDGIIDAALEYTLPNGMECCSLYPFCGELDPIGCRSPQSQSGVVAQEIGDLLDDSSGRKGAKAEVAIAVQRYAAAQRRGLLNSLMPGWLYPDRVYLWSVLENPSMASLRGSEGARAVRRAAWTIAEEGLGGLRWAESDNEALVTADHDTSSETIIEVERDETSSVEKVKELRALLGVEGDERDSHTGHEESDAGEESEDITLVESTSLPSTSNSKSQRTLYEWVRQGSSSRLAMTALELPSQAPDLASRSPTCSQPLAVRSRVYLSTLHSDLPSVRCLSISVQPLIAIIRYCIIESAARANKGDTAKWRRDEVSSVLRSGIGTLAMSQREMSHEAGASPVHRDGKAEENGVMWPLLENRNSHIVAQISSGMAESQILAQALLLLPDEFGVGECENDGNIPSPKSTSGPSEDEKSGPTCSRSIPAITHLIPFIFFSGITLHTLLSKKDQLSPSGLAGWQWTSDEDSLFEKCWTAVIDGLEDMIVGLNHPKPSVVPVPSADTGLVVDGDEGKGEDVRMKKGKKKVKGKKIIDPPVGKGRFDILAQLGSE